MTVTSQRIERRNTDERVVAVLRTAPETRLTEAEVAWIGIAAPVTGGALIAQEGAS